jgi:hypothetical protein
MVRGMGEFKVKQEEWRRKNGENPRLKDET